MMKIALLVHDINNPGGIITYVERLAKGLLESGHSCDILKLVWKEKSGPDSRVTSTGYVAGETNLLVHPIFGWSFPPENRVPYKGDALESAIEKLSSYDIVIWETPAPSMSVNKEKRENLEWMQLFRNTAKQIVTIHDGNLLTMYPHLIYALPHAKSISVTAPHPRGFNSAKHLGLPATLVMIPQYPSHRNARYEDKKRGFIACQIFKPWKHVDEPVRAISYMNPTSLSDCKLRDIAGIGLTYYYMTSKDKCKYYHPKDAREDLTGKRIWDTALQNGMNYHGPVSFKERDRLLEESMLFLDPSYVDDGLGNHLNGAVPEAMRLGCVPIGKPLTFKQSIEDETAIYQPKCNYLEIPQNVTDEEYAAYLEMAASITKDKWEEITQRNYDILDKIFDYRIVAQQLVAQAMHGVKDSNAVQWHEGNPSPSERLQAAASKMISTFKVQQEEGI